MKLSAFLAAAFVAAGIVTSASAAEYRVGDIVVGEPWARATPGRVPNGAAYMALVNEGTAADRLLGAATDAAERAELHTHSMEGGVMKMGPVDAVEVTPGSPTVFQPGGLHVMLIGLKAPLEEGQMIPLTLTFEHAGTVEVMVAVGGVAAMGPETEHGAHGNVPVN